MSERHPATPPRDRIPALVNPKAGSAKGLIAAIDADPAFVRIDAPPDALQQLIERCARDGARRVLVAGGDGTIAAAAATAAERGLELAVLPGGTLNHFARDLDIPTDVPAALALAATGVARRVDVARVNGRLFLSTSSVGAYVAFVRTRERLEPRLGYHLASFLAAVRILARLGTFSVELEANGEQRHYRSPLIFVAVGERKLTFPGFGRRVEGGRGGLHVIVVRGKTRARALALLVAAAARGLRPTGRSPHTDGFMVRACTIHLPRASGNVALDGEILREAAPLRYELEVAALAVVAPPEAPAVTQARDAK
jgi:diacylglycerol kinase family enzyme